MNIATIFTALVTIAKAVPIIKSLINQIVDLWIDYKVDQHRDDLNLHENKLLALQKAIKDAKTDQDRIALSIILHDINSMQD